MEIQKYRSIFLDYLDEEIHKSSRFKEPNNLYDPIRYILSLGGKRIRPVLTLMSNELFGGNYKEALPASLAIEMFHNFTLIHDDIMDKASLRRGKETVHKKWDENIGILSGDALMILSYQMFEPYKGSISKKILSLFSKTALQICEGQQYDMDFETRNDVLLEEYLKMIRYKTAVLLACSLQIGAIIACAKNEDELGIYQFGLLLGLAFQLQDDYLDTFGTKDFGKKFGGDILENKKTYLYLKVVEIASNEDRDELLMYYSDYKGEDKIENVKNLFIKYDIPRLLLNEIENYSLQAFQEIEKLSLSQNSKDEFIKFGRSLMKRKQ